MDMVFDCTTCGACCTSETYGGGNFVVLFGDDGDRFTADELAPDSAGCDFLLTMSHGPNEIRCVFLTGTLGERSICSAYARRPQVCRDFEAGSDACVAARALKFGPGFDRSRL